MKIAVVCGGLSNERDVSITSGSCVARALREKGHKVVLVDLYYGYSGDYTDPAELFAREQEDFRYCVAGENGKLQATFDMYGIKYTGSGYLGSAIAMNKELSKIMFRHNGINTPPGIVLEKGAKSHEDVGFPCVVKPCSGGSSVGTSIVHGRDEYEQALEIAFKFENRVLVEKYVKGRELTVGVIDGKAMPVIEIIPKSGWYDYKNKYQAGLTEEICPAPISEEETDKVQRLAERVSATLMIDVYCRADFLLNEADGELYCLEANTLPGMTPTSLVPQMGAAQGMDFGEVCEKIIEVSMEKYK